MDYCGCLGTSYYACLHVQKKRKISRQNWSIKHKKIDNIVAEVK